MMSACTRLAGSAVALVAFLAWAALPGPAAAQPAPPVNLNENCPQGPVEASASAVISNGTITLGVNDQGHLNVSGFGLTYVPTGNEVLNVGCLCEGWGVADAVSGVEGHASRDTGGVVNLSLVSFASTATTATSVVDVGTTFRVTHDFRPSAATPFLYEILVTIQNTSGAPIGDLRYTRGMDWDVNPTPFDEFVTIQGTAAEPTVLYADNNGFQNVNPLVARSSLGAVGDFVDFGPTDQGAHFDLGFGPMAIGASQSFTIFYGAAGDETTALGALAAVGAQVYSFGQPNTVGGPDLGQPNTFIFAYGAEGFRKTLTSGPDLPDVFPPFATPDSITFEMLNTTCSSQATFDFELNGVALGSTPSDPTFSCTCSAPTDSFAVTDTGLIASAWDPGAPNAIRFVKSGGDNALAWTRALLQFGADTETLCIFDQSGGSCDVPDLCAADYTFGPVDASAFWPATDGMFDSVVEVGQYESTAYDFTVFYRDPDGPPVLIEDTVPAEWSVELLDDDGGNATAKGANKKDNNKSATKIRWLPGPEGGDILVWAETRQRPNGKYAPTSCGALILNDGALAYEVDEFGEPLTDEFGNRLPPIAETDGICLAAVKDVNGDGVITRDGSGDEDGDGLTDYEEACVYGTDPCVKDFCFGPNDVCIDADGIATAGRGLPGGAEVFVGLPLTSWPTGGWIEGLDWFDNDATCSWTLGDDLHLEDPAGACGTAIRDAFHNLGFDCAVLDLDASFFDFQQVDVDLETGTSFTGCPGPDPRLKFYDANGNLFYDNGEDIVLDANNNGVFD